MLCEKLVGAAAHEYPCPTYTSSPVPSASILSYFPKVMLFSGSGVFVMMMFFVVSSPGVKVTFSSL